LYLAGWQGLPAEAALSYEARERLEEARERLEEARERLEEARERLEFLLYV